MQINNLTKEETLTIALRRLFEQYGYRRYRMSNFESYDLYFANKRFLESEGVITFTDATGKLMALKPDVTMSIVKHTRADEQNAKLYYNESVFRTAPGTGEYREISQTGVELIGAHTAYDEAEVALLAVQSLAAIGKPFVLNFSHMGFVTGLFDSLNLSESARVAVQSALRGKNANAVQIIALENGCTKDDANALASLVTLSGTVDEIAPRAQMLVRCDAMQQALDSIVTLCTALSSMGMGASLQLDFSLVNDIDYYNGIIFQGFVDGVPRAVLAGGRYDNLMRRFNKPQPALGFALYLGELDRLLAEAFDATAETILLYEQNTPPQTVLKAVQTLSAQGNRVRALAALPNGICTENVVTLCADGTLQQS